MSEINWGDKVWWDVPSERRTISQEQRDAIKEKILKERQPILLIEDREDGGFKLVTIGGGFGDYSDIGDIERNYLNQVVYEITGINSKESFFNIRPVTKEELSDPLVANKGKSPIQLPPRD